MANKVFANMREVSCKAAKGKSICAFPDVCMTPPENPATPPGVPVPYPNTGMASDATKGSRKVKITKKEVMLKNKSYFKKSMGDEAGCAAKKGVITSTNRGKVYFTMWSMDVKVEKSNCCRMADLTTHNHMSVPGNSPPWPYIDGIDTPDLKADVSEKCAEDRGKEEAACKDFKPYGKEDVCDHFVYSGHADPNNKVTLSSMSQEEAMTLTAKAQDGSSAASDCMTARACQLVPYQPTGDQQGCCPSQTGHHLVEAGSFFESGRGDTKAEKSSTILAAAAKKGKPDADPDNSYSTGEAPCICAFGPSQWRGSHGQMHTMQGNLNKESGTKSEQKLDKANGGKANVKSIKYGPARDNGVAAVKKVFPKSDCQEDCLKAQLDAYHHDKLGINDGDDLRRVATGRTSDDSVKRVSDEVSDRPSKKRRSSPAVGE